MRRAASVVRLAPSLIWRSQQKYYIMFYDTVVLDSLNSDDPFKQKHTALIADYQAHTLRPGAITLTEVAEMKRLSEAIIMNALAKRLQDRASREQKVASDSN